MTNMVPYCPIWSSTVPYGLLWPPMVPYSPLWLCMVPFILVWLCIVLYGPVWSYMVPYDPLWSCMVFEIFSSPIAVLQGIKFSAILKAVRSCFEPNGHNLFLYPKLVLDSNIYWILLDPKFLDPNHFCYPM